MYSRRLIQVLLAVLSILIATRASWFHGDVAARQLSIPGLGSDLGGGSPDSSSPATTPSDSPTSTVTDTPTSTTDEPSTTTTKHTTSAKPTTTSTETTTTEDTSSSSSTTSTTSSPKEIITPPPNQQPTSTSSSTTESTSEDVSSSRTIQSSPSTTPKPVTRTTTVFNTSVDSQGQTHVQSSESIVVSTPSFSDSDGSKNTNGGITATERNTIIGVTVGVGGAIILTAAGILYWRLRNKRRGQDENEELITYGPGFGGPGTAEKTEPIGPSANVRSPFQSTLETYHAPTQANTASNF
ncbi:hypothetical protein GGS21DRAFT_521030 [Xylaria nigripes]|nr:hypothetical protein GGS21DRAFT_521030 [Xylaria nigripes]